jgi:hypothetical protein
MTSHNYATILNITTHIPLAGMCTSDLTGVILHSKLGLLTGFFCENFWTFLQSFRQNLFLTHRLSPNYLLEIHNNLFTISANIVFTSLHINKIQRDATVCRYLFTATLLYMFRVFIAPIIRQQPSASMA